MMTMNGTRQIKCVRVVAATPVTWKLYHPVNWMLMMVMMVSIWNRIKKNILACSENIYANSEYVYASTLWKIHVSRPTSRYFYICSENDYASILENIYASSKNGYACTIENILCTFSKHFPFLHSFLSILLRYFLPLSHSLSILFFL